MNEETDMNVRFQKTPRGEVAILPRKEYEALVARAAEADEDKGTARLVALARDAVAEYIAFKTGLSQGYISDVETGRRNGTAAALREIANALKVPLDLLVRD
jgi:hypothetical protein